MEIIRYGATIPCRLLWPLTEGAHLRTSSAHDQILCSVRSICPARSPMIIQAAMVFPVVTRGMIEPSADSVDLEASVYDRQGIATHFCRTRLMVVSTGFIADEVFQFSPFQVARHDFPSCVRSKRSRIANFAAKFDTSYHSPQESPHFLMGL